MILDTDILIQIERKKPEALAWLGGLPDAPYVAGIAALELLAGCVNTADLRRIEAVLSTFRLLWPSETELDSSILDYGALRLAHGVKVLDRLIAATALSHKMPIATFDKHFAFIPGLTVVQPY